MVLMKFNKGFYVNPLSIVAIRKPTDHQGPGCEVVLSIGSHITHTHSPSAMAALVEEALNKWRKGD